jgi:hypothetical protein
LKPRPHPRYQHLTQEEIDRMQADGLFVWPESENHTQLKRRVFMTKLRILIYSILCLEFVAITWLTVLHVKK